MRMKKQFKILVIAIVILIVGLSGCTGGSGISGLVFDGSNGLDQAKSISVDKIPS